MKCNRCNNTDPKLFAYDQGVWYCRKCVRFGRMDLGQKAKSTICKNKPKKIRPKLKFELTPLQEEASQKALSHLKKGKNVFVYAATGAGKTEMCYASICEYLRQGKKVGFAISRRQVVLEIAQRLREVFPDLKIVEVCQGHTSDLDGEIIVCTIHQLYRYPKAFDLLILDEVDAFPYAGNTLLKQFVEEACCGQQLCLSATIDPMLQKEIDDHKYEVVSLFQRPHKKPLIVPKVYVLPLLLQYFMIYQLCKKFSIQTKQTIVFVPRKKDTLLFKFFLRRFGAQAIHSMIENKDELMERFRQNQYPVLISTTLLERGITIPGVQVIVFRADHPVFSNASLIQIFGRVGRKFSEPYGEGVCLCQRKTKEIKTCVRTIEWMNQHAKFV